jgi:hypothetical protein
MKIESFSQGIGEALFFLTPNDSLWTILIWLSPAFNIFLQNN